MYLIFGLICFAVAIIALIFAVICGRRAALRAKYRPFRNTPTVDKPRVNNHPRYRYLLNLLHGDKETADRLSDTYGVDKAINDLLRDRMR